MKKNNLLLSIFAIMFFVSCSDIEPLDSTLLAGNSTNNSSGGNSGGSGGSSGGSGSGGGSGFRRRNDCRRLLASKYW